MTAVAERSATAAPPPAPPPRARRRRVRAPRFTLALPAWAWYIGFFALPVLVIVVYSFGYRPNIATSENLIGLDRLSGANYGTALNATFFTVFKRTLEIAVVGTLLCLVVALPLAYFLATKVSPRWRTLLLGLTIVPFWTSFLLRTFAWRIVLAPNGFASDQLQSLGAVSAPLQLLDTKFAVQLGVVYNYLPLMIFPLYVAFERLDPRLREAGRDLGAGRLRTFVTVTMPLAMPGVVAGCLLVFIPLSGDYVTASILGGAKGTMVGSLVAGQFLQAQDWALGSAMAVLLIVMILSTVAVVALAALVVRALLARLRRVELASAAERVPAVERVPA